MDKLINSTRYNTKKPRNDRNINWIEQYILTRYNKEYKKYTSQS